FGEDLYHLPDAGLLLHRVVAGPELDGLAALQPARKLGPQVSRHEQAAVGDDALALEARRHLVRALALRDGDDLAALKRAWSIDLLVEQPGEAADEQH